MSPTPIKKPEKNFFKVVFSKFKPMSENDFLSHFKNSNVVKSAAIVPIIPWTSLSNLPGKADLKNEKAIKSPVNTVQKSIAFSTYFIFDPDGCISFITRFVRSILNMQPRAFFFINYSGITSTNNSLPALSKKINRSSPLFSSASVHTKARTR